MSTPEERVVAFSAHNPEPRPALHLTPGDVVSIGERHPSWSAFVFVEGDQGAGWVPARLLSADSDVGEVLAHYNTKELQVRTGEELTVLERDDVSGWLWCISNERRQGWVPAEILRPLPNAEQE